MERRAKLSDTPSQQIIDTSTRDTVVGLLIYMYEYLGMYSTSTPPGRQTEKSANILFIAIYTAEYVWDFL